MLGKILLRVLPVMTGLLLSGLYAFSQNILPPLQPEQDACGALLLCGGSFTTPYSYQGTGNVVDLSTTPCASGEDNSMWLKVTVAIGGSIEFRIIPIDTADDYDFAVVDITRSGCLSLSPSEVVRCNFNNNNPGSNPLGIVGLSDTGTTAFVQGGYFGNPFAQSITAVAGQTYLIMINNFGHDSTPGPSKGFTIDFSGSTATFLSNSPPAFEGVVKACSDSTVTVTLTTPVLCSSIAPDGSEFYITPSIPIAGATGQNCVNSGGYTSEVTVRFSSAAPPGKYGLYAQLGVNGTTLLNLCGDSLLQTNTTATVSIPFQVPRPVLDNYLPPDTTKCNYSTIPIAAEEGFVKYLWSSGQSTPVIEIIDPGTYFLTVTDSNACVGVDSISIKDSVCPQYVYLPSAFTPNGDGRNDLFRPKFAGAVSHYKFAIFDRWGRQVFESGNPSEGWNGTAGGRPQPEGVYVWMCIYELFQQPEKIQKGTVMLIR